MPKTIIWTVVLLCCQFFYTIHWQGWIDNRHGQSQSYSCSLKMVQLEILWLSKLNLYETTSPFANILCTDSLSSKCRALHNWLGAWIVYDLFLTSLLKFCVKIPLKVFSSSARLCVSYLPQFLPVSSPPQSGQSRCPTSALVFPQIPLSRD